jgi:hypothetical protein
MTEEKVVKAGLKNISQKPLYACKPRPYHHQRLFPSLQQAILTNLILTRAASYMLPKVIEPQKMTIMHIDWRPNRHILYYIYINNMCVVHHINMYKKKYVLPTGK